jgi:hypothetical protein
MWPGVSATRPEKPTMIGMNEPHFVIDHLKLLAEDVPLTHCFTGLSPLKPVDRYLAASSSLSLRCACCQEIPFRSKYTHTGVVT